MRNQEAARYARWAAMTAGAITVVVAGVYAERALREYLARRHGPPPVPVAVQQETADVSYSFSNQDGTTFTIRASHATQFKEGDRALLEDVWVTIYGKKGDRNDNIHTHECSYAPSAGNIQCTGDVEIDIQGAAASPGKEAAPVHVTTSNISFNKQTGLASTPEPVNLTFAGGRGTGTGLSFDSQKSLLRMERGISFEMTASDKTGGLPVSASAAVLEFQRDERTILLRGPVQLRQGDRQLTAGRVAIGLDPQYHAQNVTAEENPVVSGTEKSAGFAISAQQFTGALDASGTVQQIAAIGGVNGTRKTAAGDDHFSAGRVDFAMVPGHNLLKQMTASGSVAADIHSGANTRTLKTDTLVIHFAPPAGASSGSVKADRIDEQRIESAETQGAATIESKSASEMLTLKAAKFVAQFDEHGKLQKLEGHSGTEIMRVTSSGVPQTSDAAELVATFGPNGDWSSVDETGNVRLAQSGQGASASRAHVDSATNTITLDGSPVFSDATSRTSAGSVTINQKTGEIHATGGVTTQLAQVNATGQKSSAAAASNGLASISLGQGDAHISADTLSGNIRTGAVTFNGHARLWQGQAVLDAAQIALSRDAGTLEATGGVVAVFPQQAGQGLQLPRIAGGKSGRDASAKNGAPSVWQIRAQRLAYSNAQGLAHLDGGVTASSDQGILHSQTMDAYLATSRNTATPGGSLSQASLAGGLQRAVAEGNVVVNQNTIHGYADRAEYDAVANKFTFSGTEAKITDENGTTTTGRSLTYDVASDTISVNSDEGSRTLTRHRVEK